MGLILFTLRSSKGRTEERFSVQDEGYKGCFQRRGGRAGIGPIPDLDLDRSDNQKELREAEDLGFRRREIWLGEGELHRQFI